MKRRIKKKRDKQLLGELWQHQHEPWVKHWSVAYKHSMKYYERKLRSFFGCRNAQEAHLAVAIDPLVRGILVTPGGAVVIRKKDIIHTSFLDLSTKAVQRVQNTYIEQAMQYAEKNFTFTGTAEIDQENYEKMMKQLMGSVSTSP